MEKKHLKSSQCDHALSVYQLLCHNGISGGFAFFEWYIIDVTFLCGWSSLITWTYFEWYSLASLPCQQRFKFLLFPLISNFEFFQIMKGFFPNQLFSSNGLCLFCVRVQSCFIYAFVVCLHMVYAFSVMLLPLQVGGIRPKSFRPKSFRP